MDDPKESISDATIAEIEAGIYGLQVNLLSVICSVLYIYYTFVS